MRPSGRALPWFLCCALLCACGDDAAAPPDDPGGDGDEAPDAATGPRCDDSPSGQGEVPAAVLDVIERRCHACHGDPTDRFAPMSLVTWADFQRCRSDTQRVPTYERMQIRINDEHTPMPPIREPQLTPDELEILNRWLDMGAPPTDWPRTAALVRGPAIHPATICHSLAHPAVGTCSG